MSKSKTILALISVLMLVSCASLAPSATAPTLTPRTGDKGARIPWLPTLTPQFVDLKSGGFSLVFGPGFAFDASDSSIDLSDESGELIVSLNGRPYVASSYTLESFLGKYIAEMASRGGSFEQGNPYEITVDGVSGVAIDLQGTFLDYPIAGKAIAISPGKDFIVFGLGMSNLARRENGWTDSGHRDFDAILQSIKFKEEVKK